ncbi:MAG: hypothetical protein JKY88_12710 [Pseudomonadales bacterium]|nr:hypothetical protein [Pseudomonadales bacterium]
MSRRLSREIKRDCLLTIFFCLVVSQVQGAKFDFVALGDTAYNLPDDLPVYEALIKKINQSKPAFSIHVGDTWGGVYCSEENHLWVKEWFQKYDHPVLYTPGDNEWTDCRKQDLLDAYKKMLAKTASKEDMMLLQQSQSFENSFNGIEFEDSLASLNLIRKIFFSESYSLGEKKIPVLQQSKVSDFISMAENLRWQKDNVVFATVNVPGSEMNFTINNLKRAKEAILRNEADVAWIKETFDHAQAENSKAVVIALHAGLFVEGDGGSFSNKLLRGGTGGAYYWIARAIRDEADKFARPVLLINGDFHDLIIDRPFMVSQSEGEQPRYANITRLQVYGAPEMKAVRVSVDTDTEWVFSFSPLY